MNRTLIRMTIALAALLPACAHAQTTELDQIEAAAEAAAEEAIRAAEEAAASVADLGEQVDLSLDDPRNPWNVASQWLCKVTERMVCRESGCETMEKQTLGYGINFDRNEIQSYSDFMGATITGRSSYTYDDRVVSAMLNLNDQDFATMRMSTPNPTLTITGRDADDLIMTTAICRH